MGIFHSHVSVSRRVKIRIGFVDPLLGGSSQLVRRCKKLILLMFPIVNEFTLLLPLRTQNITNFIQLRIRGSSATRVPRVSVFPLGPWRCTATSPPRCQRWHSEGRPPSRRCEQPHPGCQCFFTKGWSIQPKRYGQTKGW